MELPATERARGAALAALLWAWPAVCGAATYYVATNGADSAAGTSAAPLLTLQAAVNKGAAGDTIIVRDGTYGPGSAGTTSPAVMITRAGSAGSPITLRSEHQGGAVLDCRLKCHSYIDFGKGSAYWVVKGFDIRGGYWGAIFANAMGASNIEIRNNVIHNIGNRYDSTGTGITGIYTDSGANHWIIDGNTFHDIGRTGALTGTHDHALYLHGSNFSITNNVFYGLRNGWHIQTAAGFSGTIANDTFYGPDPVSGTVGQVMLWGADGGLMIRNNIFYGANSSALATYTLTASGSCSVDHNLVYTAGAVVGLGTGLPSSCAQAANKLNVDPKLAAPGAYDFHLTAGSPAIDAGAAVPGVTTDFAGAPRPQGGGFDLGAYEYAGSAAPAAGPAILPAAAARVGISSAAAAAPAAPSVSCASAAAGAWMNQTLPALSGSFIVSWDATPGGAAIDSVAGLAGGAASSYAQLAAAVRFNNVGKIDARNGAAYAAASSIPYTAGAKYRFRLAVNAGAHAYTAYVTPPGGSETAIGMNYNFRSEASALSTLNDFAAYGSAGPQTLCALVAGGVNVKLQ